MSTITISHESGKANFVVVNDSGKSQANDAGVTEEPNHFYCNLSHEQMRDRGRISWTTPVTDKIYQFCAANGISCHALPGPELSHGLMTYIGFMTADQVVFGSALDKTVSYIKRYIKVDSMKGLLEEKSVTGKNGSDWECRFQVWPTTWLSSGYSVSESGLTAPGGADTNWMAMRRCPARSVDACVSAAVALLREKRARSNNAGPPTPPPTPTASGGASGPAAGNVPTNTAAASAAAPNITTTIKEVYSPFHLQFIEMLRAGNPSSSEDELNSFLNSREGFDRVREIFNFNSTNEALLHENSRKLAAKDAQNATLHKINSARRDELERALHESSAKDSEISSLRETSTARHDELEHALNETSRQLAESHAEVAKLRTDNANLDEYAKECEGMSQSYADISAQYSKLRAAYEPLARALSTEKGIVKGLRARLELLEGGSEKQQANSTPASSSISLLPKWTGSILGRSNSTAATTTKSTTTGPAPAPTSSAAVHQMSSVLSPAPPITPSYPALPPASGTASGVTRASTPISLNFSAPPTASNNKSPGAFPTSPPTSTTTPRAVRFAADFSSPSPSFSNGNGNGNANGNEYYGGGGGSAHEASAAAAKELADMERELAALGVEL